MVFTLYHEDAGEDTGEPGPAFMFFFKFAFLLCQLRHSEVFTPQNFSDLFFTSWNYVRCLLKNT